MNDNDKAAVAGVGWLSYTKVALQLLLFGGIVAFIIIIWILIKI